MVMLTMNYLVDGSVMTNNKERGVCCLPLSNILEMCVIHHHSYQLSPVVLVLVVVAWVVVTGDDVVLCNWHQPVSNQVWCTNQNYDIYYHHQPAIEPFALAVPDHHQRYSADDVHLPYCNPKHGYKNGPCWTNSDSGIQPIRPFATKRDEATLKLSLLSMHQQRPHQRFSCSGWNHLPVLVGGNSSHRSNNSTSSKSSTTTTKHMDNIDDHWMMMMIGGFFGSFGGGMW